MKTKVLLLILTVAAFTSAFAQESFPPVVISQGTFLGETIPLRDAPIMENWNEETTPTIINQQFNGTAVEPTGGSPDGYDPLVQTEAAYHQSRNLIENFVGSSRNEAGGAVPPDPSGAVGPNHYVHAVNLVVKIFDKSGNVLAGPTALGTFLGNGVSNGDPIVMYDQLADRFFVSQFQTSNDALIIGMSTTPDPTGTYNVYSYPLDAFPDYPHYGVWPDAYYLTANKFQGNTIYAFDRAAMIAGAPNPAFVGFNLPGVVRNPSTVFSPEPANLLGTTLPPAGAPGYIIYLQDDSWPGISDDHLKIWELDVDFAGTSTVSAPQIIPISDFDSFFRPFGAGDFDQRVTTQRIDGASGVISYMANYRVFPGHNSFVINFNVDIGPVSLKQGAIRWVELRNTGTGAFSVYQEGTWSMPDNVSRFMGSNSIDANGNIALAYNVSNSDMNPGMRYTGRLDGDPLGIMTFPETSIIEGGSYQSFSNRFGDYSQMTLDPNGSTFWHTSQYFETANSWRTRIASFELEPQVANDVGAYNITAPVAGGPFTATEMVTAEIYNFGSASQTGFDVELYLDGTLVVAEPFTGTIAASSSGSHTFSTSVDMSSPGTTYIIEVRTALAGDALASNDAVTREFLDASLGIDDNTLAEEGLLIYPVQDRNYEVFYNTTNDFGDMSFKIFDILGKEYTGGALNSQSNGYKATFNMSAAATGVYVVKITNGTESVSKQILIR